ncbi:MAG: autotransporter domain-containing protein, partial [Rickettsiales bacterium]|nr:autotransporter domain-containing protein [Rickettsiales bacterium]
TTANGGAINAFNNSKLTFLQKVVFIDNKSISNINGEGFGGAICAKSSELNFGGEVEFRGNKSSKFGGAICLDSSDKRHGVIFDGQAIFEKNQSKQGGAIFVNDSASIEFNNGLRLINNTTADADSGALHMFGYYSKSDDICRIVTITIVQKNPDSPTEFRGNKSNGEKEKNAIYMTQYSRLNFIVKKGNVDIFDVLSGERSLPGNVITISNGKGWFNIRMGGSIENVGLINEGNLSLIGPLAKELRLINFINSGTVKFGIFGNKKNDKIVVANKIILEQNTVLLLVAAKGEHKAGESYDILVSNSADTISGKNIENITIISPQGIIATGKFKSGSNEKIYQIIIEKDITIKTYPEEMRIIPYLTNLDNNQIFLLDLLTDIFRNHPDDININNFINRMLELGSREDMKETLSQMSPQLLADVISSDLIDIARQRPKKEMNGLNYRNSILANGMEDNVMGFTVGIVLHPEGTTLGFYGTMDSHFLRGSQGSSEVRTIGGTLDLQLITKIAYELNLIIGLSHRINSHRVGRNIEKLNETAKSGFFTNALSVTTAVEREFRIKNYLLLTPSLSLEASLLTHGEIKEENAGILNLMVNSGNYHLIASNLNLTIALELARLRPFISLGTKYLLLYSSPEIFASFVGYPGYDKLKSRGIEVGRLFGSLTLGFSYRLTNNLFLSLLGDYQAACNYSSFSSSITLKYLF